MNTPICDFVRAYTEKQGLRLHMPGHKGRTALGPECLDITEIAGADELYHPTGIIRQSEDNAASLFGAGRTVYSTEGSSLCIRAMVYLALLNGKRLGRPPLLLAGRNAHKTFISACALLGADVEWLYPDAESSLISCPIEANALEKRIKDMPQKPAAVYVTSPDYLGNRLDIKALVAVCHGQGIPLLVDNAHGAYLKFLSEEMHPLSLGADLCCDSAHKTLPVLTGGAYLHISTHAPETFFENADRAMALFASTSPSYLILQSLDTCNLFLAGEAKDKLHCLAERIVAFKQKLKQHGYVLLGDEPLKITVSAKPYGFTGDGLHDLLRGQNIECEFSDPDFLTMMFTPFLPEAALDRLEKALLSIPPRPALNLPLPPLPHPERVLSLREALLSPDQEIPVEQAEGHILADAHTGCPPCVPVIAPGERVGADVIRCFQYYGIETCRIVI